jgi:microcystin-dependent protein
MAIDFPNSPTSGQRFASGGVTWTYDGSKWNLTGSTTAFAPVGTVTSYTGTYPPNGWLKADGSSLLRNSYSTLFNLIGTTFGPGSVPGTTFALPDYRGTTGIFIIRVTDDSVALTTTSSLIGVPIGTLQLFATSSVPTGWLRADGTAISRILYPDLFASIGTTYGTGDGATTFNVPNISGAGTGSPLYYIKGILSGDVQPSTIAHASSHTEGGSDVITVTGNQIANYQTYRNVIINGGLDVWQRGTSFNMNTTPYYSADRWQIVRAGAVAGGTASRQASDLNNFTYCARVKRDSGNATTNGMWAATSFETIEVKKLQTKYLTFSFWARAGANYSSASNALTAEIIGGTGTDGSVGFGFTGSFTVATNTATLTTSWQRFTLTTSSVLATSTTQLGVRLSYTPVGTAGANDYFEMTGLQLEAGTTATPFEFEPFETTLRKCQRYYYRHAPTGITYMNFSYAGQSRLVLPLPVPMRIDVIPSGVTHTGWAGGTNPTVVGGDTSMGAVNFYAASGNFYAVSGTVIQVNAEL